MIINTAGRRAARAAGLHERGPRAELSEWKIFTKILFPAVLPYMLTGMRLSIGTAWLVIVAAEMLTGGVGIGFWVWDEWNNLKVEHIIIAILVIGMVGLLLEQALMCWPVVSRTNEVNRDANDRELTARRWTARRGPASKPTTWWSTTRAWCSRPRRATSLRCATST
jgi:hypothetical protein